MKTYIVGSINMDLVIEAPYMPGKGETLTGGGFMRNPGGKGANQAVAVSKLGGDARMVGGVGDAFGRELVDALSGYGVNVDGVREYAGASSGVAVIVIADGDNRIILDPGSNKLLDEKLVDDALSDACAGDYLVCQLEIDQKIVKHALSAAKAKGMTTFLNPAPAAKLLDGILCNADWFIPNQTEAEFYTGVRPDTEAEQIEAIRRLCGLGVKNVVLTLGENGSATVSNGEYIHVDACKADVVDTTGAGDTFIGAFTVALSEGKPVAEAMRFASRAASLAVTKRGAQQAVPYRSELD